METLIDAPELHRRLSEDPALVVLDVRWALGDPDGRAHYEDGHIPGAVYVDLETELAGPPDAGRGRHPLPAAAAFQEAARGWGVSEHSHIVAYDDVGNLSAARVWWLLHWGGQSDVQLLDGGLGAWRREAYELESGAVAPARGDVRIVPGGMPVLDADGAAEVARSGMLLDARAVERYRGEVEPVDPRAGHIPGARSAPTTANLRADGTFENPPALARRFRALGAGLGGPIGAYCGSGVTATHEILALALAGLPAALYPGSWSEWVSDPHRPVATGPDPGVDALHPARRMSRPSK